MGAQWVMFALAALTIFLLIRSNRRFRNRQEDDGADAIIGRILTAADKSQNWPLLLGYITDRQQEFMTFTRNSFMAVTDAFVHENAGVLSKADSALIRQKTVLKNARRKETLCLREVPRETAIEKSPWFYLSNNCCMGILYNLRRITEVSKEHVDNNFLPMPENYRAEYEQIRTRVDILFNDTLAMMQTGSIETIGTLRRHCDEIKEQISTTYHRIYEQLREGDAGAMSVLYVYVNMLQETQEMISSVRKYLRAFAKLRDTDFRSRY